MFLTRKCQDISKSRSVGTLNTPDSSPSSSREHLEDSHAVQAKSQPSRISAVRQCRQKLGFLRRRRSDNSIAVRPERAQVLQWASSFTSLVGSKYGVALFRAFLAQEFAEENLEFWLAVEEFKKTRQSKMALKAQQIYGEFLAAQAPSEINIDATTRAAMAQRLADPDAKMFDGAQRRVQHLMESDIWPRFLRSEMYQELLRDEHNKSRSRR